MLHKYHRNNIGVVAVYEYFKEKGIKHCLDKYSIIQISNFCDFIPKECIPFLLEESDAYFIYNRRFNIDWENASDKDFIKGCEMYGITSHREFPFGERYIKLVNIRNVDFIKHYFSREGYHVFQTTKDVDKKEVVNVFKDGFECLMDGKLTKIKSDKILFRHSQKDVKVIKKGQDVKFYS